MTNPLVLDEDLLIAWEYMHGAYRDATENMGYWMAELVEEFGMHHRPTIIGQLAARVYEDYGTLANLERTCRVWPRELRNQYAEVAISILRLCIRDEKPDVDLAMWAQENRASYADVLSEKQRREGRDPVAIGLARFATRARKLLTKSLWPADRRAKAEQGIRMIQEALSDD